jgi:DNA-binding NarL/FixJ family response regulator
MAPTGPRALIVEDDDAWQEILSEILTDASLAVDVASNVDEAIAALRAAPHRLAVIDLALGGGDYNNQDGLRVLDAIRRLDPGCVAIMLTGYATVELAVSVLSDHGAYTCLRKEAFDRSAFRDLVHRALASPPPPEAPGVEPGNASRARASDEPGARTPTRQLALVIEDDAGWRNILGELLDDAGLEAHLCSSYGEALGRLRRFHYSVAVVDLSLAASPQAEAELDGYRLLATTRGSNIPTLVVSGVASPDDIERAYDEEGVFAYLEKQTFDRTAFLQAVADARTVEAGAVRAELAALTPRELEVLTLVARGLTNKDIADRLVITGNTVKRHLKAIFEKLGVHTRSAAAAMAVNAGLG